MLLGAGNVLSLFIAWIVGIGLGILLIKVFNPPWWKRLIIYQVLFVLDFALPLWWGVFSQHVGIFFLILDSGIIMGCSMVKNSVVRR